MKLQSFKTSFNKKFSPIDSCFHSLFWMKIIIVNEHVLCLHNFLMHRIFLKLLHPLETLQIDTFQFLLELRQNIRVSFFSSIKYRLSHEGPGDISFIAGGTISYFVTREHSERGTKYDIVTRAIKLILPSLECDNLF